MNIKCSVCELINFANEVECKRCGKTLIPFSAIPSPFFTSPENEPLDVNETRDVVDESPKAPLVPPQFFQSAYYQPSKKNQFQKSGFEAFDLLQKQLKELNQLQETNKNDAREMPKAPLVPPQFFQSTYYQPSKKNPFQKSDELEETIGVKDTTTNKNDVKETPKVPVIETEGFRSSNQQSLCDQQLEINLVETSKQRYAGISSQVVEASQEEYLKPIELETGEKRDEDNYCKVEEDNEWERQARERFEYAVKQLELELETKRDRKLKERTDYLLNKFEDANVVNRIMNGQLLPGDNKEVVIEMLDIPDNIHREVLKKKVKEIWKYGHVINNQYNLVITLENDIVVKLIAKDYVLEELTELRIEACTKPDIDFEVDDLFDDAIRIICQVGKASTLLLQRQLRIGYGRASTIIGIMEQKGYVGPLDDSNFRVVTHKAYEYFQMLEAC